MSSPHVCGLRPRSVLAAVLAAGVGAVAVSLTGCGSGSTAATRTSTGGPADAAAGGAWMPAPASPPAAENAHVSVQTGGPINAAVPVVPVPPVVAGQPTPAPSLPAKGHDRLQQEQYDHVVDTPFRAVAQHPLSTFSADVNTASYSNVRRFLLDGKLPPKDAVRVAELVNYFPYTYPAPAGPDPVGFAVDLAACPWQPRHHLVRIGMTARQVDPAAMPARNLVFLVDTSGSMAQPTRLPLVQKALGLLVDQLADQDTVTIVTYAGSAGVKLPPTSGAQKGRIRAVVDGLSAGGSTDGSSGITVAYEQARAHYVAGGANRVILCTDGDFNVGVTSPGELVRLIEGNRKGGVFLTVLGFGMGNLKDATLEQLARYGNGHYAYVDSEAEARKVFVDQGAALVAVAKDVKLQVEFNPGRVAAYRPIGYENRALQAEDFKDDTKDAGDLGSGHTVTALYEVVPAGVPLDLPGVDPLKYQRPAGGPTPAGAAGEWLTVKMRYKHPESDASLEVAKVLGADATPGGPAGDDVRLAAAVAEFGLLLRDSPYKGAASYDRVLGAAEAAAAGPDPGGHRAEFAELVRTARKLAGAAREEPAGPAVR